MSTRDILESGSHETGAYVVYNRSRIPGLQDNKSDQQLASSFSKVFGRSRSVQSSKSGVWLELPAGASGDPGLQYRSRNLAMETFFFRHPFGKRSSQDAGLNSIWDRTPPVATTIRAHAKQINDFMV